MKLQCNRKQLDESLSVVAGAASARASLPILSHVYIEAQSDTVRLVGSDLEQWVECRIPRWSARTVRRRCLHAC